MRCTFRRALCGLFSLFVVAAMPAHAAAPGYDRLVELFREWRRFQQPETVRSVPDYGATALARKQAGLPAFQRRLASIDVSGWPVARRNDWRLVEAEMHGLDFDLRVLRPFARDPAFYVTFWPSQTDVPARDGPAAVPMIALYAATFPLDPEAQRTLQERLEAIPPLLDQARRNLQDSNARDLWVYSVQSLRGQARALTEFERGTLVTTSLEGRRNVSLAGTTPAFKLAIRQARAATESFISWVEAQAPRKTGPSGVGVEHYDWYLKHVHLLPYDWKQEETLLRRELERAHAALRMEEHRNRHLPPLQPAKSADAFRALSERSLDRFLSFLVQGQVIPDKPYLRAALREQLGRFVPANRRQFFDQMTHREPMLLLAHDYHWFDLARMRDEPSDNPIRRTPLLWNMWDSRAEGFATAFEEVVMNAGLYDDNPRVRELVWIMLANRAARGLASLYVQANLMSIEQAGQFHARWTPRGWAGARDDLTAFEQLLYLRQPGYGTSYISGKLLLDRLIARRSHELEQQGRPFVLRDVIGAINDAGMTPTPLIEEELTRGPTTNPLQQK